MATILVLWDRPYPDRDARSWRRNLRRGIPGRHRPPAQSNARTIWPNGAVIFREALKINGTADTGDLYGRFAAEQARGYANRADELRRRGRALPGAENALRALAKHGDVIQSVLTGNTRSAAEIKLQVFGLGHYIDFDSGA